jgi:hypothetical protein
MSSFHAPGQRVIVESLNEISDLAKGELRAWLEPWLQTRGTTITTGTVTAGDATTSTKGLVQLAGDLAGTAASPQIAAGVITDAEVNSANKDGAVAVASMRTLGSGAAQAAAGNDSRFGGTGISYGSSPPASPADGQLWMFPADATNGVNWMFRYRSGSSSTYKWEFVGGTSLNAYIATSQAVGTASSWVDLATSGPTVTCPRAGDYAAQWRFRVSNVDASVRMAYCTVVPAGGSPGTIQAGTGAIANNETSDFGDFANPGRDASLAAIGSGVTLRLMYYATSTNVSFSARFLAVTPVRVI